jgi:hypothetical protein
MAKTWDDLDRGQHPKDAWPRATTLSGGLYHHGPRSKFVRDEEPQSTFLYAALHEPRPNVIRGLEHKGHNGGFDDGHLYAPPFVGIDKDEESSPSKIVDMTKVHGDRCACDRCGNAARPPASVVMSPEALEPKPASLPRIRRALAELGIGQDEADERGLGFDSWSEEMRRESILPRDATLSIGDVAALLHTTPKYVKQLIQEGVLPPAPYVTAGKHRRWTRRHLDALQHVADKLGLLESRRMSKVQRERLRKLSHVAFDQILAESR